MPTPEDDFQPAQPSVNTGGDDFVADDFSPEGGEDFTKPRSAKQTSKILENKSYGDIVKDPKYNALQKAIQAGIKFQGEMGQGVADVVSGVPGMIGDVAHGLMPTKNIPAPGGQFTEESIAKIKKAKELADQGKWSEAAKQLPVIGGMYDYATSHPIGQTAGALVGGELLGGAGNKLVDVTNAKLSAPPKPPTTILGATPEIKNAIGILKPANPIKAVKDYPDAIARLKAEDPTLGQPNPDFLGQLNTAINGALTENRHYYEGHVGPAKAAGMRIDMNPIADAIEKSISPLLEHEDSEAADSLRALADKYRKTGSVSDVENMLQEINAKVRDINNQAPGAASQAIRANETKTVLTAQAKAFRQAFYDGLNNWNVGDATRAIQREYGKILGFKLDAEQLYSRELKSSPDPEVGTLGKIAKVGQFIRHPVRGAVGAVADALNPDVDNIAQLQKVFRDFQGQASAYPTPPVQAPKGRKQLGPAPAPPAGALNAPTNAPAPQGPIPPGMGPSAAYPTNQRALPAPTQKMPGDTYGPGGQGPVVQSEQVAGPPPPPPTVGMIKIQGRNGPEYVTQDELYRILAAQKGRK